KVRGLTVDKFFSLLTLPQWAGVTGLIVGLSILTIYYVEKPRPANFRPGPEMIIERGLEAYQPQGPIREIPRAFQWPKVPCAAYYEVKIFDPEEKSLWRGRGDSNVLNLSEELRRLLARAGEYSWEVRAYTPDDTPITPPQRIRFTRSFGLPE